MAESCASENEGLHRRVYSWGANSHGQLAQGHQEDVLEPREITCVPDDIQSICGGGGHTLAITKKGRLLSCGSDEKGQAGQGHDKTSLTSVEALKDQQIIQAAGGWDFTLSLSVTGEVFSWGSNAFGQLGSRTTKSSSIPMAVNIPGKVVDIAAGLRHAVATTESGQVYTWGQGRKGQLGVDLPPKVQKVELPTEVMMPGRLSARLAVAGSNHTAVLTSSGEVCIWGCNKHGQVTISPETTSQHALPYLVPSEMFGGRRVVSLHSGWTHLVSCTEDGSVYTWGRADYGQLGRSCDLSHDWTPQPVISLQNSKSVTCGSEHNLAIDADGHLVTWGWNEHGMCATGDEVDVKVPHKVAALNDREVSHIGSGAGHSFVILT
ncbi:secretion-regulating guanine nucleotide exchange factor-like [Haliotis rubra]|uniref:secretion-regulating guanine nucleotide exchange factor-like n=1 Tax=Haliotis rubra TaxID=36100 RepID=UPI001EE5E016|nr:secretion-regulating guanine nucleotide exchange factor-like [Haliotis rubra]